MGRKWWQFHIKSNLIDEICTIWMAQSNSNVRRKTGKNIIDEPRIMPNKGGARWETRSSCVYKTLWLPFARCLCSLFHSESSKARADTEVHGYLWSQIWSFILPMTYRRSDNMTKVHLTLQLEIFSGLRDKDITALEIVYGYLDVGDSSLKGISRDWPSLKQIIPSEGTAIPLAR